MTHRIPHGSGAKGPDELRRQIEHTRSQLGDTVAQLMDKADVKGRARARAADLRDKAGAMTVQLRVSARHAGHAVQDRAAHAGHLVQDRAAHAGHVLQDQAAHAGHAVQDRAARAGRSGPDGLPQQFRAALRSGKRHPGALAAVGVLGAAAVAAGFAWRRQRQR
ncbi:DUF3618 domain-containing protein [Streptomyces collinus]|uniref:Alanine-rich protein n=1 Tax=Streptomyces collinus (strain DSM 40733 / Tue 365) TaxID=1214242 RepID=S5VK19_STRC3|nr:DUF3618 domain-containing protein [Streptomyces collinus]AGS68800.1 hypothetical protein B446_09885 [Streptomyces collinus Tu 365]UJA07440.1 hypothetical protein HGI10_13400 [Streptomyces collinus]UJA17694.1 hypothetical protein HGI09_50700 [Streptomyces collinus]